jgi:stringent starvation protein B
MSKQDSKLEEELLRSEARAKPYLVRAIVEWCEDDDRTPMLLVQVNDQTRVPQEYVGEDGHILFNLSARTTHKLQIDNEFISFAARFNGESRDILIPFSAVHAIYDKETAFAIFFHTAVAAASETTEASEVTQTEVTNHEGKEKPKRRLKLVE